METASFCSRHTLDHHFEVVSPRRTDALLERVRRGEDRSPTAARADGSVPARRPDTARNRRRESENDLAPRRATRTVTVRDDCFIPPPSAAGQPLRIGAAVSSRLEDAKLVFGLDPSRGSWFGDDGDLLPDRDVAVIPVRTRVRCAG